MLALVGHLGHSDSHQGRTPRISELQPALWVPAPGMGRTGPSSLLFLLLTKPRSEFFTCRAKMGR